MKRDFDITLARKIRWYNFFKNLPGDLAHGLRKRYAPIRGNPPALIERGVTFIYPEYDFCWPPDVELGYNARLRANIAFAGSVTLGDDVVVGHHSILWAIGGGENYIKVGNGTGLGAFTVLMTRFHQYRRKDVRFTKQGPVEGKPIIIGDDCWIGIRSIIMPGVTVGKGAVVGAGAVVTKSVQPYKVVAGNPAKIIGERE
ncbi:MAG: acyltransferase [Candidatus Thermoplasmatota archaeon]|jgi:maltose O-acetyltransferase|nr:acyltransferase [Candidatus Thermoplasmatota archaeon]MDP7264057.1 acyltransferase [Candidatus Thermoplasmatota archaeon]